MMFKAFGCLQQAVEQINGREGETATFLSRCALNLNGLSGGFALRHLKRYLLSEDLCSKDYLFTELLF